MPSRSWPGVGPSAPWRSTRPPAGTHSSTDPSGSHPGQSWRHCTCRTGPERFEFPQLDPATFLRLPAMLADSLPDRFGNALVNAWMAEHGVPAARITPLDRLAYAADRAMGALEFRPPVADAAGTAPTAVQLADLVVAARSVVSAALTDDDAARAALGQLIQVDTSAHNVPRRPVPRSALRIARDAERAGLRPTLRTTCVPLSDPPRRTRGGPDRRTTRRPLRRSGGHAVARRHRPRRPPSPLARRPARPRPARQRDHHSRQPRLPQVRRCRGDSRGAPRFLPPPERVQVPSRVGWRRGSGSVERFRCVHRGGSRRTG